MNAFTSGCIHIKQAGLLDSKIALSSPHLALCLLWVLLPLRHSCNFGSFLFQFKVWDVLQSCCLVFSWNEAEILRFGLVCMTWQDRSPWVCKACREDAGELCRAEENRPGASLSILPAGRYSQSWISKTEHFDFCFKWATQYFQKMHGNELIFIQYGGLVNQDQRWGEEWDDGVDLLPPMWVYVSWSDFPGTEMCGKTLGSFSIQMLRLQPQHWGLQPLWKQILSFSCNPALNGKHTAGFGFSLWTRRRKRQHLHLS